MLDEMVPRAVRELVATLATPVPMRRGSVSERFMKCGQKECRCQHDRQARHGPYYSLTRVEGGKTKSRYLSVQEAELARQQIEAGQSFRDRVETYWRVCEEWADSQLADSPGEGKKGASRKASPQRLPPR